MIWPDFIDDPEVGGWIPFGATRMEVNKGIVSLTGSRGTTGLVTRRTDLTHPLLKLELADSSNVNAWLGMRLNVSRTRQQVTHVRLAPKMAV